MSLLDEAKLVELGAKPIKLNDANTLKDY